MLTFITHVYTRFQEVCRLTSPMDMFELPELSTSTYIKHYLCWHTSHMGTIKMLYLCWLASLYIWVAWFKYVNTYQSLSLLTYIKHNLCWHTSPIWAQECFIQVCWLASPKWNLDLIKYADLHHPRIFYISWSMLTYITHGYIWVAWFKYVNTYQSLSLLTYIKHNLCWHTSPMGTIRMIYSSMLTCITHV